TSPHQAQNASDQRDGRALQRPYRRGLGHYPLRLIRALDRYHQTLYSSNINISVFHSADEFEIIRQQRTQFAL
ncbi:MAG: Mobile element protein, partial [Olavius algarvensis Gamma 1 endosymbiont]